MALLWPEGPKITSIVFNDAMTSTSGGQTATGEEQTIVSPGGRWEATLKVVCNTEEEILQYRAWKSMVRGKTGVTLFSPKDGIRPRDLNGRMYPHTKESSFRDGSFLFDHAGFATAPVVTAQVAWANTANGIEVGVTMLDGSPGPQPGHYIGIGERLHIIRYRKPNGTNTYAYGIWPWLRQDVTVGMPVILDRPLCPLKLASDDTGKLELTNYRSGSATIEMVEAF